MKLRKIIILFTAASCVAGVASAVGNPLLARGMITFGFGSAGWRWASGHPAGTSGIFSFYPEAGVFVADRLWLGGRLAISYIWAPSETGPETDYYTYTSIYGGADYYFDLGRWAPFVGLWGMFGDSPGNGLAPRAGAKFFIVPRTALALYYEGHVTFPGYKHGPDASHTLSYGFQIFF